MVRPLTPFPPPPRPPGMPGPGEVSARKHRQLCHLALRAAIEANMREPSEERREECSRALVTYREAVTAEQRERELQEQVDDALEAAVRQPLTPPPAPELPQELGPVMTQRAALFYAVIVASLITIGWACSAASCHF